MRIVKGDLSAPVLAIIVTIGIIAAGLILLAWFWWFAPTAGKTGTLVVVGTPVVNCSKGQSTSQSTLYITLKNVGNENITVSYIVLGGKQTNQFDTSTNEVTVPAGSAKTIKATFNGDVCGTGKTVDGFVATTAGTYSFTAYVVKSS
ncbi:hypothetical protein QPL79_04845 [Ignisphaera sp. 4213-co]|uniref:CARDB domain-containing protein n=1 Tax=Ignisphaera cupida TaxID=3050454 RepID=A0ABD4Z6V8_9CREN|nr:hypothetical protein [Ignisphaera sp. 4213-co]MDK6028682.1 hypothetical protein [Ignisphaera sp. 4213-co]